MEKKVNISLSGFDKRFDYCYAIKSELEQSHKHNKVSIEKLAEKFGIVNKNLVKEMTELAIVLIGREIVEKSIPDEDKYEELVELYNNQVNLSHRTSQSMLLQQYSTPIPISYIASRYVYNGSDLGSVKRGGRFTKNHFALTKTIAKENVNTSLYFEPSAGNGLLTIAIPYNQLYVNELDDVRLDNLKHQPFAKITNLDASQPFPELYKTFTGIITNPPFGTLPEPVYYDTFPIKALDHLMALRVLDTMKDNGRAAIIIGGHTDWDEMGRIQAGKNRILFNYLYSRYNVEDVILIDGHKLYSRQGTAFNVRLILINGRKEKVEGFAPLKTDLQADVLTDFGSLWNRVFTGNKLSARVCETEPEQQDSYYINDIKYIKEKDCKYYPEGSDKNHARSSFTYFEIKEKLKTGVARMVIANDEKQTQIKVNALRYKADGNTLTDSKIELKKIAPNIYITSEPEYKDKYSDDNDVFRLFAKIEYNNNTVYVWQGSYSKKTIENRLSEIDIDNFIDSFIDELINVKDDNKFVNSLKIETAKRLGISPDKLIAKREQYFKQKEIQDLEKQKQKEKEVAEKLENEKIELQKQKVRLLNGEFVSGNFIITLAKEYGIDIHIRTIGAIRDKNVSFKYEKQDGSISYQYHAKKGFKIDAHFVFVLIQKIKNERIRIAKVKAEAKLKLLNLSYLNGYIQTQILSVKDIYFNKKNFNNELKKFYKDNLSGNKVKNLDTNQEIYFTNLGLNKSIYGRKNEIGIVVNVDSVIGTSIHYLPQLLEFAKLESKSDKLKQNHKSFNGVKFWNFRSKIIVDNKIYNLIIPVLEVKKADGNFQLQYSIEYAKIKKSLAVFRAKSENQRPQHKGFHITKITNR